MNFVHHIHRIVTQRLQHIHANDRFEVRARIRIKIPLQVEAIDLPLDPVFLARLHPRLPGSAPPHMPVAQTRVEQRRDLRPPLDFENVIPR